MKKVTTSVGIFGPYQNVEILEDRYRCDGGDLPFTVVGNSAVISDVQPGDFPPPLPEGKTPEEIQEEIIDATQKRLDDFARTRNYDGILSACTYSDSLVQKFRNEGQYCLAQRDATWAKLYEILGEVQAGLRPMPSGFVEIEAELPELIWPV